jgi:voltage-gated potassium channel Kch
MAGAEEQPGGRQPTRPGEPERVVPLDPAAAQAAIDAMAGHAIVAGFGIPGRAAANLLAAKGVPFCVVELNPATVSRCSRAGLPIIQGNVCEQAVMHRAGIERASFLALAMPNENAVLEALVLARRLNPTIKILARCRHVSTAMEAAKRGADDVVSEEEVIGKAFSRTAEPMLPTGRASGFIDPQASQEHSPRR